MTIEQVKNGIAMYVDYELLPKINGWQKWVFGASATMFIQNLDKNIATLKQNNVIKMMNLIDENNDIKIDDAYTCLLNQARKNSINVQVPSVGNITFTDEDVTKLYNYMKGEQTNA